MKGQVIKIVPGTTDGAGKRKGGYGFIRDEDGQNRFFQAGSLLNVTFIDLVEGAMVEFEPYEIVFGTEAPAREGARPPSNGLRARSIQVL